MTRKEYNGYYNYETWLTALWIDNDEYLQNHVLTLAERAKDAASLESELEGLIEEMNPKLENGLFADLLSAAVSEINFTELAHNYLEEVQSSEEEERKLEAQETADRT